MIQVEHLVRGCHSGERHDIEEMLLRAAEYTRAAVELEVKSKNLRGLDPDQLRKEIKEANTNCFVSLNGFIVYAERVNRICRKHDRTQVYWGEDDREEYGKFALELVTGILGEGSESNGIA